MPGSRSRPRVREGDTVRFRPPGVIVGVERVADDAVELRVAVEQALRQLISIVDHSPHVGPEVGLGGADAQIQRSRPGSYGTPPRPSRPGA